jgi:hypothetical protein
MSEISRGTPFIDIDEWRDEPRRHRYVHGGFEGTNTLFSFYLPPEELYQGRFFQFLEGGAGGHENLLAAAWIPGLTLGWSFDLAFDELGGYLVESNQGHFPGEGLGFSNDYELFEASADTAVYSRQLAAEMYGNEPHHGYIWGVSGGGARSGFCLENRPDVWQGGVPHAGIGQDTQWSPWALTWLIGRDKFPQIIDAMEPGGSGDPFTGLSSPQREALAELYRRGWPRGGENQLAPFVAWAFPMYATMDFDPGYFEDFWNEPGYLGADDPRSLDAVLLDEETTVERVVPASQVNDVFAQMAVRMATAGAAGSDPAFGAVFDLDLSDTRKYYMANVSILSGKAVGRELLISNVDGDVISPFSERAPDVFEGVEPGDRVRVSNRNFIAFCYYHRHTIKRPDAARAQLWDEFAPWAVDGHPIYRQRGIPPVSAAAPSRYKAKLSNKMIYVHLAQDAQVWPTTVWSYVRALRENLEGRFDDHFRLWLVESACHGAPEVMGPMTTNEKDPGVWSSRLVSYDGVSSQALRDVVAWVEEDVAPTFCKNYELTRDNALVLAASATDRGGVQPVVTALANGSVRTDVKVGETVTLTGTAEQPPEMGTVIRAEWDFEGRGTWATSHDEVDGSSPSIEVTTTHAYEAPGTYFASFRVSAHRDGVKGAGLPVQNLHRVRVVVSE